MKKLVAQLLIIPQLVFALVSFMGWVVDACFTKLTDMVDDWREGLRK